LEIPIRQAQYLRDHARYAEAEGLLRRFFIAAEGTCPASSAQIRAAWNGLGIVYKYEGRLDDAGRAYTEALSMGGATPLELADLYHNLGGLEHARGHFAEAEPWARRGLAIRLRLRGPNHPDVAADMAALAPILGALGKKAEAESMMRSALVIFEHVYGPEHYECSVTLNNLAALRYSLGDSAEALRLYQRALAIKEKTLGPYHPDVATTLNNLAVLYKQAGDRTQAARLYQRALDIFEVSLGARHPKTVACRNNYAVLSKPD
jgi:tetratricopeptide (TPR) repeat protein